MLDRHKDDLVVRDGQWTGQPRTRLAWSSRHVGAWPRGTGYVVREEQQVVVVRGPLGFSPSSGWGEAAWTARDLHR